MNAHQETIQEGMGISDQWVQGITPQIVEGIKNNSRISDLLENFTRDIRLDEWGTTTHQQLSTYEKKLAYAGYLFSQMCLEAGADFLS